MKIRFSEPLPDGDCSGARRAAYGSCTPGGFTAARSGLAIFVDGTERPTVAPGVFNSFDNVQWRADASALLAATNFNDFLHACRHACRRNAQFAGFFLLGRFGPQVSTILLMM